MTVLFRLLPLFLAWLLLAPSGITLALTGPEKWCSDYPTICYCSAPFQSSEYTTYANNTGANAYWMGYENDYNSWSGGDASKKCTKASEWGTAELSSNYGAGTFDGDFKSDNASAILALLPNRDPTKMSRYIRMFGDSFGVAPGQPSTVNMGHMQGMNLETGANGSPIRRVSMRWYQYYSPDYEFAFQHHVAPYQSNNCGPRADEPCESTNGKFTHSEAVYYGNPDNTYQTIDGGERTNSYYVQDNLGWVYPGYSNWSGFVSGQPAGDDGEWAPLNWRGKWVRHEIIVANPRVVDGQVNSYDFIHYVKDVTNNGPNRQIIRWSKGCTNCIDSPIDSWNHNVSYPGYGIYSSVDMKYFYQVRYRASREDLAGDGKCYGWDAWAYFAMAYWSTNAGQTIGAASEVEGGGGSAPSGVIHLRILSWTPVFFTIGAGFATMFGIGALARRRSHAGYRPPSSPGTVAPLTDLSPDVPSPGGAAEVKRNAGYTPDESSREAEETERLVGAGRMG